MTPLQQKLIEHLREDSRQSISVLAEKCGVSRKRAKDTIDRLVDTGVIRRFTVELEEAKPSEGIRAFFHVRLKEPKCRFLFADIKRFVEIVGAWSISSSDLDMQILLCAPTQARLEEIREEIAMHHLVQTMHSNMVLTTWRGTI